LSNNIKQYNSISSEKYDEFFDFLFNEGCKERCLDCKMCDYFVDKIFNNKDKLCP
jgi:hypothetical protein